MSRRSVPNYYETRALAIKQLQQAANRKPFVELVALAEWVGARPLAAASAGYLALGLLVLWPLFSPGSPPGVDTPTFLHLSWLSEQAITGQLESPFSDPYWYGGFNYLQLYSPVSYLTIGTLGVATPISIEIWYRILILLSVASLGVVIFWLARLYGLETWAAAWSGALALMSYPVVANIALFGSLPATMALPIGLTGYGLLKLALERADRRLIAISGATLSATLLTHHMTAVAMSIAMIPLIGFVVSTERDKKRAVRLLGVFGATFVATSFLWGAYFLAGLLEVGFRREVPGLWQFDIELFRSQFLNRHTIGVVVYPYYLGWIQVGFGLAGAVLAFINRSRFIAPALAMLILFSFSLGSEINPVISRFPFSGLDVSRFAFYLVPFFALLSAYALSQSNRVITESSHSKRTLASASTLGVIVLTLVIPAGDVFRSHDSLEPVKAPDEVNIAVDWLDDAEVGDAPVYVIGLNNWDTYWLPARADLHLVDGWYDEGAPNWEEIRVVRRMGWTRTVDIERFHSILADHGASYVLIFNWYEFEGSSVFRAALNSRPELFALEADISDLRIYSLQPPFTDADPSR